MRRSPGAFTRHRTLTLPRLAALMMSGMGASVQSELDALFGALDGHDVRHRAVSAQAFSKARRGLSAGLFDLARAHLIKLAQPHIDSMRWHGLRLVAADGSRLRVGTRRNHELRADHYAFALFLPGPELTLHAALHPADGAERQMLFEALDVLQARTDLLLLDRGYIGNTIYPAADFGALHHQRWRVEEAFKRLKHRLRLEAVTELDYLALQLDFGAKILADNLCILLSDLDATHDDARPGRPNRVYALGALKPILGACLLRVRRCLDGLVDVLVLIHQTRCRTQPSRSYPRPPRKAKPHFHLVYKPA